MMGIFDKGQAATEYVIIIGTVLVVTIPLLYYAMRESNVNIKLSKAEDAVNTLARAADVVYSIGPGTRKYVWIDMPKGVQTYSLQERAVSISLSIFGGIGEYIASTKAELVGQIPISHGQHRVRVEMLETGYVRFGEADDTMAPIVIWTSPSGTINYRGIVIRATTNEYSTCKYNTEDEGDADYDSMLHEFVGSALTHEKDLGFLDIKNYVYYVRCEDPSKNKMMQSAIINFTIVPFGEGEPLEYNPPIITLISPPNNYKDNKSGILFEYNVTDQSSISSCELIIDDVIKQTDSSVTRNITQSFTQGIDYGNHMWNVNCTDVHGNENSSTVWNISTNATGDFDLPDVRLIRPVNNTVRDYWLVKFGYNVTDITSGISYCDLHMFGLLDDGGIVVWTITDSDVEEGKTENITLPLFKANYMWNVSCVDNSYSANEGYSETWRLRVNATAGEEAFLNSCAGICGYNLYSNGQCVQNAVGQCTQIGGVWIGSGADYRCYDEPTIHCCCFP